MELFRYLPRECFKRMKFASFVGSTICTDQSMQHFPCEYLDTHRKLCFFRSKIGDGTIKVCEDIENCRFVIYFLETSGV